MMGRMKRLAIIGGGASGLAAAVAAARALRECGLAVGEDVEVEVFEADERVGRSILATGNGRCNFSNSKLDLGLYRNGEFAGQVLGGLAARGVAGSSAPGAAREDPVLAFFADLGLEWREEADGRLYPLANKASSVLDVLRAALADAGGREVCDMRALRIDAPAREGDRFHLRFADGAVEHADAVVLAVGGRAVGQLELPGGLSASPMEPVLGPLRTENSVTRRLNNIRVRCAVELEDAHGAPKAREEGEILFRDYGVSGIAVYNLSRFAEPGDVLVTDLLPFVPADEAETYLYARRRRMASRRGGLTAEDFLRGLVLPLVGEEVLLVAGLDGKAPFRKQDVPALARALKGLRFGVLGIGDPKQCQVARGGLSPDDLDPSTMGLRGVEGLCAAGEAVDVDGPCGGYNLHWAWASGIVAGRAAAGRLADGAWE